MSHSTDDRRVLAGIEQRLVRDDPELVALMATLNEQFPHAPREPRLARTGRRDRRRVAVIVFALVAVLGLILTALLGTPSSPPPGGDTRPGTYSGAALTPPAR